MTDTPALDVLVGLTTPGFGVDIDGVPHECPGCPFVRSERDVNPDDPGEGYFDCGLLDREVWGESPPCRREDWQARARQELGRDTS